MKVQALPIIVFCFFIFCAEKELKTDKMRVEINTEDIVELIKQYITKSIPDDVLLEEIEEMVTYGLDDFKHEVEIVEF